MRLPLSPFAEASTIEKVRFAEGAWNNRDAVAGERRAADAVHDIRGFALKLVEEGNLGRGWQEPSTNRRRSHDELSARSMR
jgi:nuclear transport factor 2 (NTF2) superfamily protein